MTISFRRRNLPLAARAALCVAACWLLGLSMAWSQATLLEVIPLRYRTVEQVIPVIQPLLASGGTVSGFQGQLVVRTTPGNLEEIKRVLASIDTIPRRLLISVRQDGQAAYGARSAEVSGRVATDQARVVVPDSGSRTGGSVTLREGDDRLRARVLDSAAAASDRDSQTVQVMDGSVAYIQVGQSVPVQQRQVVRTYVGGRVVEQVVGGTEYRDVASGFYALPRVSGDRVMIEISPQRESLSGQIAGGVNVQRVVTTVSGRLGEWIEIAGTSQTASAEQSVLLGRTSARASDARRVLVKVEELK